MPPIIGWIIFFLSLLPAGAVACKLLFGINKRVPVRKLRVMEEDAVEYND